MEVNFVYLWELEVKKIYIFFFFFWGGVLFSWGATFRHILVYLFKSQKAFYMSILFKCRYLEDNFLVQSGDFCIHEYNIRFCKKIYISPYPKIVILKNHVQ